MEELVFEKLDRKWPGPKSAPWVRRKAFMEAVRREAFKEAVAAVGPADHFKGCDGQWVANHIVKTLTLPPETNEKPNA